MFVLGLFLFGLVFLAGAGLGVFSTIAAAPSMVLEQDYRSGTQGKIAVIPMGDRLLGFGVATWAVFAAATALMVRALAWAFLRFDDSI